MLGGVYIVPLYTLLQKQTPEPLRARMIAVNNIMNALFIHQLQKSNDSDG